MHLIIIIIMVAGTDQKTIRRGLRRFPVLKDTRESKHRSLNDLPID